MVETFDNIFSNLDEATETHVNQASLFLGTIVNSGKYGTTNIPRIAQAVDSLFRWSVKHSNISLTEDWMGHWKSIYLNYCGNKWDSLDDDERFKSLQISLYGTYGSKYEPNSCRQVLSTSDKVLRQCILVRELLKMSDDALVIGEVQNLLCNHREDVLLECCGKVKSLDEGGPFHFVNEYESVDALLYDILDDKALLRCSPSLSRRFSAYALQEASSPRRDIRSRAKAMERFMGAPTTISFC